MLLRRHSRGFSRHQSPKKTSSLRLRYAKTEADLRSTSKAAYQQAVTAAGVAFERVMTNSQRGRYRHQTTGPADNVGGFGQRQSVRFAGPDAKRLQKRSITRRQARTWHDVRFSEEPQLARRHDEGSVLEEQTPSSPVHPSTRLTDSTPSSSYKRLRKSKSDFFPPRDHSRARQDLRGKRRPEQSRPHPLEGIDSSPLTSRHSKTPRSTGEPSPQPFLHAYDQDLAVQRARDEYIRQLGSQSLEQRSSAPSLRSPRQSQKSFRRTVRRSSSGNSYGEAISSQATSVPDKPRKLRIGPRARKISNSLKDKLRRVFRKTSSSNNSLPSQHIDSQRPHFGDYMQEPSTGDEEEFDVPMPSDDVLKRIKSRTSSIGKTNVHLPQGYNTENDGSRQSSYGSGVVRSRVTSWTNSVGTDITRQLPANDAKRLSIIQENIGPHQPSSSAGLISTKGTEGYALFGKPVQPGSGRINQPIDSQAIFLALQKRLDARSGTGEQEALGDSGLQTSRHSSSSFSRKSSRAASGGTQRSVSGKEQAADKDYADEILSDVKTVRKSRSIRFTTLPVNSADDVFRPSPPPSGRHKRSDARVIKRLSLQELADQNEGITYKGKGPLAERSSTFFPHQSSHTQEQPSLSRGVMEEKAEEYPAINSGLDGAEKTACESVDSASVYSRDVDGTPKVLRSLTSVILADDDAHDKRSVDEAKVPTDFVGTDQGRTRPEVRVGSTNSMTAKLEDRQPSLIPEASASRLRANVHHREKSQINNDDKGDGSKVSLKDLLMKRASERSTLHGLPDQSKARTAPLFSAANQSSRPPLAERNDSSNNLQPQPSAQDKTKPADLVLKRTDSATTLKARHSPERASRLRRMKTPSPLKENRRSPRTPKQLGMGGEETAGSSVEAEEMQRQSGSRMVELFLSSRRSTPRSEERLSSPAFL